MKAAKCTAYKSLDAIKIKDIEQPQPKEDELLIQIVSTTVTTGDWRVQSLSLPKGFGMLTRLIFGVKKPRQGILGTELSGRVVNVGNKVSKFKIGDEVVAVSGMGFGCHAQYKCISENAPVVLKPPNLSHDECASLPFGGLTALSYLRDKAGLKSGEHILINGASGSVGSAAIQVAKLLGAVVTAVCSSKNFDFVRSLGATNTIDYSHDDFLKQSQKYDVIFDVTGQLTFANSKHVLSDNGRLLLAAAGLPEMFSIPLVKATSQKRVIAGPAEESRKLLQDLFELASAEKIRPVIDSTFDLENIAQAFGHVATGHKKGSVVIRVSR